MEESIEINYNPGNSASVDSSGADDEAYDDQYVEDSTTNYGNDDDFYDNPLEQKKRPDKATRVLWCAKALVIVVLVLSAATAATLTYVFLEGDEHEDFSTTVRALGDICLCPILQIIEGSSVHSALFPVSHPMRRCPFNSPFSLHSR